MSTGTEVSRQTVRARLREVVATARPGDRLPSERDLAERWGAARMTVRNATDLLVAEGVVARRHGSGTYVLPRPVVRFLGMTSFTQDMQQRGLVPGSRLLSFDRVPADAPTAAALDVREGAPMVRFTRLRSGSGEPMAIESVLIPAASVPGLGPDDLDGSLYELLRRRYRLEAASATVTIEPVLPEPAQRRLLEIGDQQACLRLRMTDADARGRPLMTADCLYRGDRYQLTAAVPGPAIAAATRAHVRRAG